MVKYGVLRVVSACDCSSCGTSGFHGRLGSGLMWGDQWPVWIGIGFFWVGASWVWTARGDQPVWLATIRWAAIDPNPNPRLPGFWVGRVGFGFLLVLHMSTYIEGHSWVTQRGHSEGFAQGAHWSGKVVLLQYPPRRLPSLRASLLISPLSSFSL